MKKPSDNNEIVLFSFLIGILAFFALKERRIDSIKRKIASTSSGDNTRKDWFSIGSDLKNSFNRFTN